MPNGPRIVLEDALYHIMVRGNRKQKVFVEEKDFKEYLRRMKKYKRKYRFRLYGFCLMPNHIHLIGEIEKQRNLAKFMHGLNRSYTAYFNNKYGKVGHLWQGRFKSKIMVKDRYLVDCVNYVELNPVRARIVTTPHEYKWSSYKDRVLNLNNGESLVDEITF